jgi:Thioredoxin like C-terminal domain
MYWLPSMPTGWNCPPIGTRSDRRKPILGYVRAQNFASPGGLRRDVGHCYTAPVGLRLNHWALLGRWTIGEQSIVLHEANGIAGSVFYHFHARDLHLVMAPPAPGRQVPFRVLVDERPPEDAHGLDVDEQGNGTVDGPRLYQLVRGRSTYRRSPVRGQIS